MRKSYKSWWKRIVAMGVVIGVFSGVITIYEYAAPIIEIEPEKRREKSSGDRNKGNHDPKVDTTGSVTTKRNDTNDKKVRQTTSKVNKPTPEMSTVVLTACNLQESSILPKFIKVGPSNKSNTLQTSAEILFLWSDQKQVASLKKISSTQWSGLAACTATSFPFCGKKPSKLRMILGDNMPARGLRLDVTMQSQKLKYESFYSYECS